MTSPSDNIGRVLGGRYRLEAVLGIGASAIVYRAEDTTLERQVAIKILQPALAQDEAFLKRFRAEARAVAALNHPAILQVYDWGEDDSVPYLVTELLAGGTLKDLFDAGVLMTPEQAVSIGGQAAAGLAYAHARGLVHRDVKPANLLFDGEGRLRITDFGVARALAADPDLLLMDEPFGALDPVTRAALQTELARIQRETGKTIVFVTHDMDEALRLASQVVVLDQGRVVQDATPSGLLAHPADDRVRDLLGREDRGLRRLALRPVQSVMRKPEPASAPAIAAATDCRAALSRMAELGVSVLDVQDEHGARLGSLHLADLIAG